MNTVIDVTTNRQSAFFERRQFLDMLRLAKAEDKAIAVADVAQLLSTVPRGKGYRTIEVLDNLPVGVWDVSRGMFWRSIPSDRRGAIVVEAVRAKTIRSRNIKIGLERRSSKRAAVKKANSQAGTTANRKQADRLASQLEDVVDEEIKHSPADKPLSPSRLAKALNKRDIPSPRGVSWSHNSAKNLLARIARLRGERRS